MAIVSIALFGVGIFNAVEDNFDGRASYNASVWLMPFVVLIAGLTVASGLWLLASIDERLARLEEKN